VCGFVVTVGGGRERFGKEKNGKKRGMSTEGAGWCCEQVSVCECARSNVCATGTSPHVSLFVRVGSR
jgi:hypothetical protein